MFLSVFSSYQKTLFLLFYAPKASFYCQTGTQGFKKVCYLKDQRQGWEAQLSDGTDLYLLHKRQKAAPWADGASQGRFTKRVSPAGRWARGAQPQHSQWAREATVIKDKKRPEWEGGTWNTSSPPYSFRMMIQMANKNSKEHPCQYNSNWKHYQI